MAFRSVLANNLKSNGSGFSGSLRLGCHSSSLSRPTTTTCGLKPPLLMRFFHEERDTATETAAAAMDFRHIRKFWPEPRNKGWEQRRRMERVRYVKASDGFWVPIGDDLGRTGGILRRDPAPAEARFAVEEYNNKIMEKKQNDDDDDAPAQLKFLRVLKTTTQVALGVVYRVTLEAKDESTGETKTYEAIVWAHLPCYRRGMNKLELLMFRVAGDGSKSLFKVPRDHQGAWTLRMRRTRYFF